MVTLKQVAAHAGVSPTTVSFVLNGRARDMKIGEATIARIQKSIATLGYRINYHARTLTLGRSNTLGLAMDQRTGLLHRMWGTIATGVDEVARISGKDLLIVRDQEDEHAFVRGVHYLQEQRIDALLMTHVSKKTIESVGPIKAPVVLINSPPQDMLPVVNTDPTPGIREAVKHLADLGHRKIFWIGKKHGDSIVLPDRRQAFFDAVESCGIEADEHYIPLEKNYYDELTHHIAHNRKHLLPLFEKKIDFTAVFCYNDTMGLSLYSLLPECGLRVPDDLSIMGFDDLHSANTYPAMSTVSHMFREMGSRAVELALELIADKFLLPKAAKTNEVLPAKLIIRDSTAPPKKAA